jgi:hypothetical protein
MMIFRILITALLTLSLIISSDSAPLRNIDIMESYIKDNRLRIVPELQNLITMKGISRFQGDEYLISSFLKDIDLPEADQVDEAVLIDFRWDNEPVKIFINDDGDTFTRVIDPSWSAYTLDKETGHILSSMDFSNDPYKDTVKIEDYKYISTSRYEFTKAPLPPGKDSVWDTILEPVLVIGTAIFSVYLLFSVRSG